MRRLAVLALLSCVGLLGATARAENLTVIWTSANTDVYLDVLEGELEFEGEITGTETVRGYLILEWRDADYESGNYEDWINSGTGTPDGASGRVYLRGAGSAISTTTTVPSTLVSIHLDADNNDGKADVKVDGALVAQFDMNTTSAEETSAFIVVKRLPYDTHTIEVIDMGSSAKGTGDDVHIFGAAVLAACDVLCKDGTVEALPAIDVTTCRTECNTLCETHDGLFSCVYKDVNVKGQCHAECKDGPDFDEPADSVADCQTTCNEVCVPHGGLFSCFFKGENIKGQCEAVCKDAPSVYSVAKDPDGCLQHCSTACDPESHLIGCNFKGERASGTIPAVTEWGMVVMVLLVLAAGTVVIRRARALKAHA